MKNTEKSNKILKAYHAYLKLEKSLSSNTINAYFSDLNKLLVFFDEEQTDFLDATLEKIETFIAQLKDLNICPRTQARIISSIRSFYHFLLIEDYLPTDPTELLESPKTGLYLPEVLTIDEIDSLIEAIDLSTLEGHRNRAILETLYSCGLRVSELCNLKISDLFIEEGYIKIEGKGNKQRLIPISHRVIKEFQHYFINRNLVTIKPDFEDYVFISKRGKNISRIMVFHIIKELADKIQLSKNISPHTFRHSFATHLLEGGANLRAIQAMLGHESISTTEIYTHIDNQKLRSEIIEHHPRNQKNIGKR